MNSYEQIANAIYTLSAMEQSKLLDILQNELKSKMADEIYNMAENDYDAPEKEVVVEEEEEDYFLLHHANADCSHYEGLGEAIEKNAENIIAPMIALSAQRRNKVVEDLAVHFGHSSLKNFKSWIDRTEAEVCCAMEYLNNMRGIDAFSYYLKLQKTYQVVFHFTNYNELTIEMIQGRLDFHHFVSVLSYRLGHITNVYTTALTGNYTDDEINEMICEIRALDYSKWEFLVETTKPFIDRLVGLGLKGRADNPLRECCVCYDETRKKTKCGHSLCYECWNGIMRTNLGNMKCPMCRTQIY